MGKKIEIKPQVTDWDPFNSKQLFRIILKNKCTSKQRCTTLYLFMKPFNKIKKDQKFIRVWPMMKLSETVVPWSIKFISLVAMKMIKCMYGIWQIVLPLLSWLTTNTNLMDYSICCSFGLSDQKSSLAESLKMASLCATDGWNVLFFAQTSHNLRTSCLIETGL